MATIPISQLVQVNPGVLSAAGRAIDLNGVILTQSNLMPYGDVVMFANPDDVSDYFGPESDEARAAQIYFNGYDNSTRTPGALYFFRYEADPSAAFLKSGSNRGVSIQQLQGYSGSILISVDGTELTATPDMTSVTSFSEAAEEITAELTGATVTYDGRLSQFFITSDTTGEGSSIGYASGDLANSLRMTQDTGATLSEAGTGDTPTTAMARLVNLQQNWAGVMALFEMSLEEHQALSDWVNGQGDRFFYSSWDNSDQALVSGSEDTLGAYVARNGNTGTVLNYSTDFEIAAFVLGFAASLDFNRLNGRATSAWKSQSGLAPTVDRASDATALIANGYNFYGAYANARDTFNLYQPGSVSGNWDWLDTYLNQIWLNANLQLAMVNLLSSVGSVPYNGDGDALIYSACLDPIQQAVNFGAIRTGVQLSESQAQQLRNALGVDARQTVQQKGFYLQTKAAEAPASVRAERASPSCTLYYTDGGSVQSLTLASIAIQ